MKHLSLIASALAVLGLTACEKGLDDIVESGGGGQVTNSLLQVRTRGAAAGSEATVAYPVAVYVFAGDECKAAQTIGDEGQTLNIALTEGTYSVFAVGGASTADYVLERGKVLHPRTLETVRWLKTLPETGNQDETEAAPLP